MKVAKNNSRTSSFSMFQILENNNNNILLKILQKFTFPKITIIDYPAIDIH